MCSGTALRPPCWLLSLRESTKTIPHNRLSRCFKENDMKLEPDTMTNRMIKAADIYLSIFYDEPHEHLFESGVVYTNESPFEVIWDSRKAGTDSYMWVYCTSTCDNSQPVMIYDYQKSQSPPPEPSWKATPASLWRTTTRSSTPLKRKRIISKSKVTAFAPNKSSRSWCNRLVSILHTVPS